MNEYEINKAVAHKFGIEHRVNDLVGVVSADRYRKCYYDPCNNAEQAWEIMLANNISVTRNGEWYYAMNDLYYTGGGKWIPEGHISNCKPFVAAMLLFLEI